MTLDITDDRRTDVLEFLLALADDEFITGQRFGMWLSVSPTLEEDNALTSIAQDELGHARLWYDVVAEARSETTDELAIEREAADRRNSILVEREHADFADAIARNALYDEVERLVLESIRDGEVTTLADTAQVALNEEPYHREHADTWLSVLEATDESIDRLERAFRTNLEAARDLFSFPESQQDALVEAGVLARAPRDLATEWETSVVKTLADSALEVNTDLVTAAVSEPPETDGRAGEHIADLEALVRDMQPAPLERI